ncbi:gamma-glutamyltranspeptidase/glutathione hydrolase [Angulomicrobium tetraedrale]|uniref:Gamma-glutamyltranspeptidase/glutathione hydrolase n=2 Tax=Ancylobacter tetraedralis TaxID=217068 RepID=A0A839ZFH0_9HYPH|nr:gamma-glutamyltranspeptidase/glutathione hydrolase [Ancylobacter tetraedralis]
MSDNRDRKPLDGAGRTRSIVYSARAAAATSHPLASLTAIDMLRRGGNAVDAAIAAIAVQCVVEPHQTGIGGDCFALYMPRNARAPIGLSGAGRAPAAASTGWFAQHGVAELALDSPHSVTVPGAVAGWCKLLADHGRLSLETVLEPAIRCARDGYVVQPIVGLDWSTEAPLLADHPVAASVFLPGGRPIPAGSLHRQPRLAATLETIAREGHDGFYTGEVAADMVACLRDHGGLHTLQDFAEARADYVAPISTRYRGYDVLELPPSGQGLAALMMLNVLDRMDLADPGMSEADRIHVLAELAKLAYHHRDHLFGDPDFASTPVRELLSPQWADFARTRIDMSHAAEPVVWPEVMQRDTVYACVIDEDGNAISFINSLFHSFGSRIMAPRSGVLFHNRGAQFRLEPGHPNAIAGGKRPLHTLIPGMVMKDGACVAPFGVMGGPYQAAGHAELLSNILDLGLDPQQALDHPRSFAYRGVLNVERRTDPGLIDALRSRGHDAQWSPAMIGGGQLIWRDPASGILAAASDPRKDGCALGL